MKQLKQSDGFAVVEVVILIVVVALIGFVAVRTYNQRAASTTTTPSPTASKSDIKSDADIKTAETQLTDEDLDTVTKEETSLDGEAANF